MKLEVYTDGASSPNHPEKMGGWAWAYKLPDGTIVESSGGKHMTTNNVMEMWAVIDAMNNLPPPPPYEEYVIYSDSQYVVRGINDWVEGWMKRGWKTADGKPVANIPLWWEMHNIYSNLRKNNVKLTIAWVKGHADSEMNNYVDRLCVAAKQDV